MAETETENRIKTLFANREKGDKVMSLFLTAGFPDIESTVDLVLGFEEHGADMIELGMPFSDPLADGPTIQYSSEVAIRQGITMDKILEMVREIRRQSDIPLLLMGYMNPVLHFGVEKFCESAAEAGVDGLIIPDIPPEESAIIEDEARKRGLSMVFLVAPNTPNERMKVLDEKSDGFVYCVSVTGVTGAREGDEVARSVERFIDRVRGNVTNNPRMVGFGIKSHEDAVRIADKVEGFIVGSALIDTIKEHYPEEGWKENTFDFVNTLKYGKQ